MLLRSKEHEEKNCIGLPIFAFCMMSRVPRRGPEEQLNLPPGFRFYPSDEELVVHYLCRKAASQPFPIPIIAEVDLYKFNPWDLPDKALFGEKEWYFFSPRDRKYPNGSRPNRAAGSGYWKATGTDKPINTFGGRQKVGVKKALVFYTGKAPKGMKTNWIMHEYRLADSASKAARRKGSLRLDDWVLCRIYKKSPGALRLAAKENGDQCAGFDEVLECLPEIDDAKLLNLPSGSRALKDGKPETSAAVLTNQTGYGENARYCMNDFKLAYVQAPFNLNNSNNVYPNMKSEPFPIMKPLQITKPRADEKSSPEPHDSPVTSSVDQEMAENTLPPAQHYSNGSFESGSTPSFPRTDSFLQFLSFDGLPSPSGRFETIPSLGDASYFPLSNNDFAQVRQLPF